MYRVQRVRQTTVRVAALALAAAGGVVGVASTPAYAVGETIGVTLTTADLQQALTPQPSVTLGPVSSGTVNLTVDNAKTYQSIDGFGAAFTDASAYLLQNKLSAATRDRVMRDLFTRGTGIGLSLMRVPMGSSDYTATPPGNPPGSPDPSPVVQANFDTPPGLTPENLVCMADTRSFVSS